MKVLHLNSGLFDQSVSRQVSAQILERLRQTDPALQVVYRDLVAEPLPHLNAATLTAGATAPELRTAEQSVDAELSAQLVQELFDADVILVGAPMYNFSVPTQLKAWFDRVLKAGVTFRYTENGPQGLAGGRRAIIASARGGLYGDDSPIDFQESYLRAVFGLMGITDVAVIRAEGVNMGDAAREQALRAASEQIDALFELAGAA